MTGAGPEGPHTRPKAKPGSEVVRAGCTDLESICEPDGDPDALNLSNCGNVGSFFKILHSTGVEAGQAGWGLLRFLEEKGLRLITARTHFRTFWDNFVLDGF